MIWLVGSAPFLLVHLPIMLLAASIGVWLFYVQHQFEDTFWAHDRAWNCTRRRCTAARITICRSCCAGSPPISACTTSIICAAGFRFTGCRWCCAIIPSLADIGRLTLGQSLSCVRLVLWDEAARRLISFRELRTLLGAAA